MKDFVSQRVWAFGLNHDLVWDISITEEGRAAAERGRSFKTGHVTEVWHLKNKDYKTADYVINNAFKKNKALGFLSRVKRVHWHLIS